MTLGILPRFAVNRIVAEGVGARGENASRIGFVTALFGHPLVGLMLARTIAEGDGRGGGSSENGGKDSLAAAREAARQARAETKKATQAADKADRALELAERAAKQAEAAAAAAATAAGEVGSGPATSATSA